MIDPPPRAQWADATLVDRAAAFLHSRTGGVVSAVPWWRVRGERRERLRILARGILQIADGTLVTFPGDPGLVPRPASLSADCPGCSHLLTEHEAEEYAEDGTGVRPICRVCGAECEAA